MIVNNAPFYMCASQTLRIAVFTLIFVMSGCRSSLLATAAPADASALPDDFAHADVPPMGGAFIKSELPTADSPHVVAVNDINGDNNADVIVATSKGVMRFLGRGDGTFGAALTYGTGVMESVVATDLDADGKADLVAAGYSDAFFAFHGTGDGSFGSPDRQPYLGVLNFLAAADFHLNGRRDVIVADSTRGRIAIFPVRIGGGFGPVQNIPVQGAPAWLSVADLDVDGQLDILFSGAIDAEVGILYGAPAPAFSRSESLFGPAAQSVTTGDLDSDGRPDVIVSRLGGVTVYLNKGHWVRRDTEIYNLKYVISAVVADFNGDGLPDVAVAGDDHTLVLPGVGDGTFGHWLEIPTPNPVFVASADLNNDGRPDLVVAEYYASALAILLNVPTSR